MLQLALSYLDAQSINGELYSFLNGWRLPPNSSSIAASKIKSQNLRPVKRLRTTLFRFHFAYCTTRITVYVLLKYRIVVTSRFLYYLSQCTERDFHQPVVCTFTAARSSFKLYWKVIRASTIDGTWLPWWCFIYMDRSNFWSLLDWPSAKW